MPRGRAREAAGGVRGDSAGLTGRNTSGHRRSNSSRDDGTGEVAARERTRSRLRRQISSIQTIAHFDRRKRTSGQLPKSPLLALATIGKCPPWSSDHPRTSRAGSPPSLPFSRRRSGFPPDPCARIEERGQRGPRHDWTARVRTEAGSASKLPGVGPLNAEGRGLRHGLPVSRLVRYDVGSGRPVSRRPACRPGCPRGRPIRRRSGRLRSARPDPCGAARAPTPGRAASGPGSCRRHRPT